MSVKPKNPVVILASGAPVYLYEFQHPPSMIQKNRPSFVGVDHADELFFIQGTCFAKAHLKATGKTFCKWSQKQMHPLPTLMFSERVLY